MVRGVQKHDLFRLIKELARKTRQEIEQANLAITNFEDIARKYEAKFAWQEMDAGTDGHYIKDLRLITLNSRVSHQERRNFSFCHELIHDRIVCDDDFYAVLHEFTEGMSKDEIEQVVERLCNIGAAELLIPSSEVEGIIDEQGFSIELIPDLCERFSASSIAVAFKLLSVAKHDCYLFIAEKREFEETGNQPLLIHVKPDRVWHLWVVYSGSSPSAKYNMGRNYPIASGHLMYQANENGGYVTHGEDDIPRRNSKKRRWEVKCECMAYKGWVFGFFHEREPVSQNQLRLF